ncbi:MAG: hypothetical protein JSU94_11160 [Phycisphaerales bacterium]|nr:MAG: hypothetical protein JSU94_11160 [Phycisphaerales bacterium]
MGIQDLSDDLVLVELPHNTLRIAEELNALNDIINTRDNCDVIIDFFKVEVITSSNISNLLILHDLLSKRGRQLVLSSVRTVTKCIFTVAGIRDLFEFADDKPAAISTVRARAGAKSPT